MIGRRLRNEGSVWLSLSRITILLLLVANSSVLFLSAVQPASAQAVLTKGFAVGALGDSGGKLARDAGVRWIRSDVTFDDRFKSIYSLSQAYGLNIIGILDYQTLKMPSFKPSRYGLEGWAKIVNQAQANYPAISVWEIWNEPTLSQNRFGYMDGSPQHYFDMLKSAYQILKAGNAECTVLGLGGAQFGSSGDYPFAQTVFSLGGDMYMDGISVHAYPYQLNSGQTWGFYRDLWTNEFSKYKNFGKPIWLTETGLKSDQMSESDQATYLDNSYRLFQGLGAVVYTWYQIKDYDSSNGTPVTYGLARVDYAPKPAYVTYKNF